MQFFVKVSYEDFRTWYKWILNGTDIVQTRLINFNSESGDLSFSQFSWREQGAYRCTASNEFHDSNSGIVRLTSMSPIINLWQISLEIFDSPQPTRKVAGEYDYLQLSCGHGKRSIAKELMYTWYDTGTTMELTLDDGRLFIDKNGNLHFAYLRREDGSRDGYSCTIFTMLASGISEISRGSKIVLTVSSRIATTTKPVINYRTAEVTARKSSTAILECLFSGYDAYKWSYPAQRWGDAAQVPYNMASGKYTVSHQGRRLTITNVREEDDKSYYCYGSNSAGTASSLVQLHVVSEPIFINPSPLVDKTLPGKDYTFSCETTSVKGAKPPQRPVWYINSRKLDTSTVDESKFEFSSNYQILTVKRSFEPSNFVCIQCDVHNDVDVSSANTCIAGFATRIVIVAPPPDRQEIRYGQNVDFSFIASAGSSTPLNFRWMFKNEVIGNDKPPPYVYFNPNTMKAYIDTSSLTREEYETIEGQYRIIIFSRYENITVKTEVVLLDGKDDDSEFMPSMTELLLIVGIVFLSIINVLLVYILWKTTISRPAPPVTEVKEVEPAPEPEPEPKPEPKRRVSFQPTDNDEESNTGTVLTEESLESSVDPHFINKR